MSARCGSCSARTAWTAGLRHEAAFEAAARAIPGLAEWTDPGRSRALTPVLPGGPLLNVYRGQTGPGGRLALPGLFFAGDAVATTTPVFGRGVTTTLRQARELLRPIDEHGRDLVTAGESFDAWCAAEIKPWVDDHMYMDELTRRRWAGEDTCLRRPLPSDLILAAGEKDPAIQAAAAGYLAMTALPGSLRPVEPRARALYRTGWRRSLAAGPDRDELAALIQAALRSEPALAGV